jgi:hypothetical protein
VLLQVNKNYSYATLLLFENKPMHLGVKEERVETNGTLGQLPVLNDFFSLRNKGVSMLGIEGFKEVDASCIKPALYDSFKRWDRNFLDP